MTKPVAPEAEHTCLYQTQCKACVEAERSRPESQRAQCPTCGSNDKAIKRCGGGLRESCPHGHEDCPDSWHAADPQPDAAERAARLAYSIWKRFAEDYNLGDEPFDELDLKLMADVAALIRKEMEAER